MGEPAVSIPAMAEPPIEQAKETTADVDSNPALATDSALVAPDVVADGTEMQATSTTSVADAMLFEGFETDEPTFEVEPLRP